MSTHTCKKTVNMQQNTYAHSHRFENKTKTCDLDCAPLYCLASMKYDEEFTRMHTLTCVCSLLTVDTQLALIVSFSFCGVYNFVEYTTSTSILSRFIHSPGIMRAVVAVFSFHAVHFFAMDKIEKFQYVMLYTHTLHRICN